MKTKMQLLLTGIAALMLTTSSGLSVASDEDSGKSNVWRLARGGQLYDNWAKATFKSSPETTHPSYPATGKKKGAATWRCKECHGWDYRGKDGAYGKGSHYTGIKGVSGMIGAPVDNIASIIRNKTHGYSKDMLSDDDLQTLGAFVSGGLIDARLYIDYKTKKAKGSVERGARFYQTVCAVCHGFDGKAINFKTAPKKEFVGTIAQENPWEIFHKIQNGQPGVPMVALRVLSTQDLVDILAYAQTLEAE